MKWILARRFPGLVFAFGALLSLATQQGLGQCFRQYKHPCTEYGDYKSGQLSDEVCDQSGSWWYRCCLTQYSQYTSSVLSSCECIAGHPTVFCDLYRSDGWKETYTHICTQCNCASCGGSSPCTCEY